MAGIHVAVPGPTADEPREQQELLPGLVRSRVRATRRTSSEPEPVAEVDPVARVLVDVPLAHLDRGFDYAVPASMADISWTVMPSSDQPCEAATARSSASVSDRLT